MKTLKWQVMFAAVLIFLSALLYGFHYVLFHDAHHIFIYMVGDIAFVPIEVLLVTLILHRLLEIREKRALLNKLNMVIGAFFSELGVDLLKITSACDVNLENLADELLVSGRWNAEQFSAARHAVASYEPSLDMSPESLVALRDRLVARRAFLLRLLENPNLLEHEAFTDLLWAVFHLMEELDSRDDIGSLPQTDRRHLAGDVERVYRRLVFQWLAYMEHLGSSYPYLFSLALRTNPFDTDRTVEVQE